MEEEEVTMSEVKMYIPTAVIPSLPPTAAARTAVPAVRSAVPAVRTAVPTVRSAAAPGGLRRREESSPREEGPRGT